jgi:large subunit ribosomal protein L15
MLHDLRRPHGFRRRKKIVGRGRGSGHGRTSGRGNKGQNARASGGVRPGFEGGQMPLIRRIPKRGFTFTPKEKYQVVSLERLKPFAAQAEVTPELLIKAGIISKKSKPVKILGDGELKHALKIRAHAFSKSALEKIKKIGGEAQKIEASASAKKV